MYRIELIFPLLSFAHSVLLVRLGSSARAFLAIVVIFHILPWFGLELLDTARDVAEFDLPMRVMRVFWGGP
jgi:hypothetical protein